MAFHHRYVFSEDCCGPKQWEVSAHGKVLDPRIEEGSGLVFVKYRLFWTHNDDEDNNLYLINDTGATRATWRVAAPNFDWEEITADTHGTLYLGNIGNNFNQRIYLRIWRLDPANRKVLGSILFRYADQTHYLPLWPGPMDYDCEAMVHSGDSLYLFTKNKSDRSTTVYAMPDKDGYYELKRRQSIPLLGMVTGASLRRDGKELALLTYQRIYFFDVGPGFDIAPQPKSCVPIWKGRQMEAISYWGNDSLLVSNEQRDLFLVSRKKEIQLAAQTHGR